MYARKNEQPKEELDSLQLRVAEIAQLLSKNNKAMATSQTQLTQMVELLQHSFTCYDQLEFIHSTQSQAKVINLKKCNRRTIRNLKLFRKQSSSYKSSKASPLVSAWQKKQQPDNISHQIFRPFRGQSESK